jgi:hypothetical protein
MASDTHIVTALPVTKAEQEALEYLASGGDFRAYQRMRQVEQERQQHEQRCQHNRRFFANLTFTLNP